MMFLACDQTDQPSLVSDQLRNNRVLVFGRRLEGAAEGGFRIVRQDRLVEIAIVVDEAGSVVGDELSEESEDKECQEDPQRLKAARVGAEVLQPSQVDRRDFHADQAVGCPSAAHARAPGYRSRCATRKWNTSGRIR